MKARCFWLFKLTLSTSKQRQEMLGPVHLWPKQVRILKLSLAFCGFWFKKCSSSGGSGLSSLVPGVSQRGLFSSIHGSVSTSSQQARRFCHLKTTEISETPRPLHAPSCNSLPSLTCHGLRSPCRTAFLTLKSPEGGDDIAKGGLWAACSTVCQSSREQRQGHVSVEVRSCSGGLCAGGAAPCKIA